MYLKKSILCKIKPRTRVQDFKANEYSDTYLFRLIFFSIALFKTLNKELYMAKT